MSPILFSIGRFSLPSFGLFLALAFIFATFLVWRQARAWDLDEEKILDLTLLTFFGGLAGARIYFILLHLDFFLAAPIKMLLFNRYPGFSFWGGFLAGVAILTFFSKRYKKNFWQVADMAVLSLIAGLTLGNLGCLLGGCSVGIESSTFYALPVVGLVGKRLPVSLFESVILFLLLLRLWPQAIKFHVFGQLAGWGLFWLGLIKLILEFYHDQKVSGSLFGLGGYFFSAGLIFAGLFIHYHVNKRNLFLDFKALFLGIKLFLINRRFRQTRFTHFWKSCYNKTKLFVYNTKISWKWKLRWVNKLLRKAHVKPTPKNLNQY